MIYEDNRYCSLTQCNDFLNKIHVIFIEFHTIEFCNRYWVAIFVTAEKYDIFIIECPVRLQINTIVKRLLIIKSMHQVKVQKCIVSSCLKIDKWIATKYFFCQVKEQGFLSKLLIQKLPFQLHAICWCTPLYGTKKVRSILWTKMQWLCHADQLFNYTVWQWN